MVLQQQIFQLKEENFVLRSRLGIPSIGDIPPETPSLQYQGIFQSNPQIQMSIPVQQKQKLPPITGVSNNNSSSIWQHGDKTCPTSWKERYLNKQVLFNLSMVCHLWLLHVID